MRAARAVLPVLLTLVAAAPVDASAPTADARAGTPLVQVTPCADDAGAAPARPGGPGRTTVHFIVPARVVVRLDAGGKPVAATTNTRCAPSAGDQVVVDASGDVVATTVDIGGIAWTGDWTVAGAWHPWPVRS